MKLLHLQFRFTEPEDVARFGDGWRDYDEGRIVRLPARRLIELEQVLGVTLVAVLDGVRGDTVLGDLAGTWLALHVDDPAAAGEYADYTPVVPLIDWRTPPGPDPAGGEAGPDPLEPMPEPPSPGGPAPE